MIKNGKTPHPDPLPPNVGLASGEGMLRLRLSEVRAACMKHPGLWDELLRAGAVHGAFLHISRAEFEAVQARRFKHMPGTWLHDVMAPAVDVVDWILGTDLGGCGGCAERELKLNAGVSGQETAGTEDRRQRTEGRGGSIKIRIKIKKGD